MTVFRWFRLRRRWKTLMFCHVSFPAWLTNANLPRFVSAARLCGRRTNGEYRTSSSIGRRMIYSCGARVNQKRFIIAVILANVAWQSFLVDYFPYIQADVLFTSWNMWSPDRISLAVSTKCKIDVRDTILSGCFLPARPHTMQAVSVLWSDMFPV